MDENKHIDSFLDYYLSQCCEPNYAVLIKGKWGCGKSYYIKKYLNTHGLRIIDNFTNKQEKVVIYLSLFGVSSKDEIDEKIIEFLHPIISSSKLVLLRKILKTVPASTVLGALSKSVTGSELASTALVEGLDIFVEYFQSEIKKKGGKKIVVVLDDFERAEMPVIELLGIVNEFVEILHIPCIIIAEKKTLKNAIVKQRDESTMYGLSLSLEKVVGKEFKIETSAETVIDYWLEHGSVIPEKYDALLENDTVFESGDESREILKKNRDLIAHVIEVFGQENYRAMKHVIVDFDRFVKTTKIGKILKDNDEFARLLLGDFLVYQYAQVLGLVDEKYLKIKSPVMNEREIEKDDKNEKDASQEKKEKLAIDMEWEAKLKDIPSLRNSLKDGTYETKWFSIWKKWLDSSFVDFDELKEIIMNSIWFEEKKKHDYLLNKLCNWKELTDNELKECCRIFYLDMDIESDEAKPIVNPSLLVNLFDSLLTLAKNKNIVDSPEKLIDKMYEFVSKIGDYIHLLDGKPIVKEKPDNPETGKFAAFIVENASKHLEKTKRMQTENFFNFFNSSDNDRYQFAKTILENEVSPIGEILLTEDDVPTFIKVVQKVPITESEKLSRVLRHRYESEIGKVRLMAEINFIKKMANEIKSTLDSTPAPQPLNFNNLRKMQECLEGLLNSYKGIDEKQ